MSHPPRSVERVPDAVRRRLQELVPLSYAWSCGYLTREMVALCFANSTGRGASGNRRFQYFLTQQMTAAVDKSNQRVKRMFGEIAPRYDFLNHLLSLNTDKYWRWRTVRLAPPDGTDPILDVCTGTGDLAFAYFRRTRGEVEIVGSDFCAEMLAIGNRKKEKLADDGQVTFIEADSQNLPFDDNRFQLVTVAFGLRNIADPDRGLREMTRVCKPGGRVAVLEFSMPGWQPFKMIYGFYFLKVLPRIGQWMMRNEQEAYSYLPESVGQFPSGEALAQRMRDAGLSDVRFHCMTLGIATLYIGTKPGGAGVSNDEARS